MRLGSAGFNSTGTGWNPRRAKKGQQVKRRDARELTRQQCSKPKMCSDRIVSSFGRLACWGACKKSEGIGGTPGTRLEAFYEDLYGLIGSIPLPFRVLQLQPTRFLNPMA